MAKPNEDLDCLHQTLRNLLACGLVFELDNGSGSMTKKQLEQIDQSFQSFRERGGSATDWLECEAVPECYRKAAKSWLSDDQSAALNRLARSPEARRQTTKSIWFICIQAFILFAAIYISTILTCVYLVPTLESIQRGSHTPGGPYLRSLVWLSQTMPVWMIVAPIMVIGTPWILMRNILSSKRQDSRLNLSLALSHLLGSSKPSGFLPVFSTGAVLITGLAILLMAGLTVSAIAETMFVALQEM